MSDAIISRLRANDPTFVVEIDPGSTISLNQFCSSIQENSSIKFLLISNSNISMVAANEISAALSRMPFLDKVHMISCPWENVDVATTLASSLAGRSTLQTLSLNDCNIDSGCVQVISTSFSSHQSLRGLDLTSNPIGDVGAIAIGSLFASNESLKKVALYECNVGTEGLKAIARRIAHNRTLEHLNLSDIAAALPSAQNAFKRTLYNDDSIETVLTGSNHTLKHFYPVGDADLCSLLAMNSDGPEEARRRKLARFLEKSPETLLSVGVNDTLLPSAIEKLGRVGVLNAMYLSLRDIPGIFEKKGSS